MRVTCGLTRESGRYLTLRPGATILAIRKADQVLFGAAGWRWYNLSCADVAQSVEHRPCKSRVAGSIPAVGLKVYFFNLGRYPSGQRGLTVNQLAIAFGGSNPPLPTIEMQKYECRLLNENIY